MRILLFIILIYNHGQSQGQGSSNLKNFHSWAFLVNYYVSLWKSCIELWKKHRWYGLSTQQRQEVDTVKDNQHEIYNTESGPATIMEFS